MALALSDIHIDPMQDSLVLSEGDSYGQLNKNDQGPAQLSESFLVHALRSSAGRSVREGGTIWSGTDLGEGCGEAL